MLEGFQIRRIVSSILLALIYYIQLLLWQLMAISSRFAAVLLHRRTLMVHLGGTCVVGAHHLVSLAIHIHLTIVITMSASWIAAFINLIAVTQPVVEVIAKLLQDVHVIAHLLAGIFGERCVGLHLLTIRLVLEKDSFAVAILPLSFIQRSTLNGIIGNLALHHFGTVHEGTQSVASE